MLVGRLVSILLDYGFGQAIGMITFDQTPPAMIPGHSSNALTYKFPVLFATVDLSLLDSVVRGEFTTLPAFVKAAQYLQVKGVRAITTNCGMLALLQKDLANAVEVPVFASSLLQVPIVHRMLGKRNRIGIITAYGRVLEKDHRFLENAGIHEGIPIAIKGLEGCEKFWTALDPLSKGFGSTSSSDNNQVKSQFDGDFKAIETEITDLAEALVRENPDIGAFVLECTELPVYSYAVQRRTGLPVFDTVTLVNYVYESVVKKKPTYY
jgi:Asp/Glu/hydantoin racemase